jgi:hypothetical protein
MFDAQLRADIETIDVTINNYERLANAPQAWERIKKSLEGVQKQYGKAPSQQLKAEIAAFVHTVVANQGECLQQNVDNFIERMRQLSAV